ncbi:MAG: DUF1292 domain-containing protein [Clostridia bacterium]
MAEEILDEEMDDEDSVIVLESAEGEEIEFHHIATIDYKDEWYVFLQPVELGDLAEDEMIIFKLGADDKGNDIFEPIEDEALIDAVYAEYEKEAECECDGECDCDDDCECDEHCDCGDKHCDCGCHEKE